MRAKARFAISVMCRGVGLSLVALGVLHGCRLDDRSPGQLVGTGAANEPGLMGPGSAGMGGSPEAGAPLGNECGLAGCDLGAGDTCTGAGNCESGACVATASGRNVCCAAACGSDEECREDGSSCEAAAPCVDGSLRCSGSTHQRCSVGRWVTQTECGRVGCSLAQGGCLRAVGDECSSDAECGEGACLPSVAGPNICCTAACSGNCRRCAPSGTQCEYIDDDAACGVIACPPDEACRDYPDEVATNRCVAGRCGTAAELCDGVPRDVGRACSDANLCDAAGECTAPKRELGESCLEPAACLGNICVDGVCCAEDCAAGSSCTSDGRCGPPTVSCAGSACAIEGGQACCLVFEGGPECTSECPRPPNIPVFCDQHRDCADGQLCCATVANGQAQVFCQDAAVCTAPKESVPLVFEICDSPAIPDDAATCSPGGTCTLDLAEGWRMCAVP